MMVAISFGVGFRTEPEIIGIVARREKLDDAHPAVAVRQIRECASRGHTELDVGSIVNLSRPALKTLVDHGRSGFSSD